MNRPVPSDMSARDIISGNLDTNILVEAGAGSGKTTSMVNRMVCLITQKKTAIDGIAAITFTRKAAQELKERFQNKLEERYRQETDGELRSILKAALDNMEQCYIGTIHSFCAAILRERPVEGGIDPDFTELDEMTDTSLLKLSWQQYLLQIRLRYPEKLAALSEIGLSPADLEGIYNKITVYPDVEIVCTETEKPNLRPALDKLKPYLYKARRWIPGQEPDKGYDGLQESILSSIRVLQYYDMDMESNILKILEKFEKEQKVTLNRWLSDKETTKQITSEINTLSQTEIQPVLQKWREYAHFVAMDFILPGVSHYEQLKRNRSGLNFQDLLLKAVQMLKKSPEVRTYFQSKYRYLLIDEFQDTDPIQAELMFFLTGKDVYEEEWSKLIPIPGSLFVVGDPKQSIYRFRRADIDIYNRVKQLILETGGMVLELTTNFRSINSLGDWFNEAFRNLLPDVGDTCQASFSTMQTLKEDMPGTASGVQLISIPDEYTKKEQIVRQDARHMAEIIRKAVDGSSFQLTRTEEELKNGISGKPEYRDFMILLRYKDSMEVYARTLEEHGIPVRMSGGSSLSQVEEIKEFLILLQYLKDQDNQVLLLAVLRGMFFGVGDAMLAKYRNAGGSFYSLSDIPEALPEATKELLEAAFEKLRTYIIWTRRLSPVTAVEKTAADIGLIPLTLSGALPQAGCGYIFKILELLKKNSLEQGGTFSSLVDDLQDILEQDMDEELDISGEDRNAVRIMNLHKAKGLEAPVVFLAHPCKRPKISPDHHIQREEGCSRGFFLIKKETGEFSSKVIGQPVDWAKHESAEQRYQDAEETRLLYVAATRAKNLLFISDSEKSNAKNPWEPLLQFIPDEFIAAGTGGDEQVTGEIDGVTALSGSADGSTVQYEPSDAPIPHNAGLKAGIQSCSPGDSIQHSGDTVEFETPCKFSDEAETTSGENDTDKLVEEFSRFTGEVSAFLEKAKQPGYSEASPSNILRQEPLHTVQGGYGAEWGTAMHAIIEKTVRDPKNLESHISMILEEHGFTDLKYSQQASELITELMKSELYARICNASRKLTEIPFMLKLDEADPIYREFCSGRPVPVTLEGVIDLAIHEEDGWTIIDYKTNHIETDEDLRLLTEHYATQIRLYCRVWERITGERVKSGELYFMKRGLVQVNL